MQGEGGFNSFLSDALASCFKILVLLALCFSCSLFAIEFNRDHSYITVDILPLCTEEGQIILEYTNSSSQDLLVDPRFLDSAFFDAHNAGLAAGYADGQSIDTTRLKSEHFDDLNWFPLSVGQSVRHKIDLRDYAVDSINFEEFVFLVYGGYNIKIITTKEGKEVYLQVNTDDDYENDVIMPECWK